MATTPFLAIFDRIEMILRRGRVENLVSIYARKRVKLGTQTIFCNPVNYLYNNTEWPVFARRNKPFYVR